jgi:hypothetical protein
LIAIAWGNARVILLFLDLPYLIVWRSVSKLHGDTEGRFLESLAALWECDLQIFLFMHTVLKYSQSSTPFPTFLLIG